jgi:hypothetical protein
MLKKLEGPKVVWRKCNVYVPQDGDETSFAKYTVKLQFEIAPRSVNDERMSNYKSTEPDTDWLLEAIKGWGDYVDGEKKDLPFNPEELQAFLDVPYQRVAAIEEYFNCANGGMGKRKN